MGYYIDLNKISIDQYKNELKSMDLIPSWMILRTNLDAHFDKIKNHNILKLDALKKRLKTKEKVKEFSKLSRIPENYLIVLRRVINGIHPKPNRLKDFIGVRPEVADKLEKIGIKNTLQLYDEILTKKKRDQLSKITGISKGNISRLSKLTDLSRIRWVGNTFAYVLLEAGYESAEEVAKEDYTKLYKTLKQLNKEREIYKGNIGEHDMKLCVEAAKKLDFDIEY